MHREYRDYQERRKEKEYIETKDFSDDKNSLKIDKYLIPIIWIFGIAGILLVISTLFDDQKSIIGTIGFSSILVESILIIVRAIIIIIKKQKNRQ